MNRLNLIYHPTTHNATFSDTCVDSSFTGKAQRERCAIYYAFSDEGNAGGFSNSKAQRERFAEYHDFPISHSSKQDSESGYHYFGARYMDHELMTMWLSVDPMSDKYPSLSSYNYCAWTRPTGGDEHRWIKYNIVNNPVKLLDPDGEEMFPTEADALKVRLNAVEILGESRVGGIFNMGDAEHPNYAFHVFGYGKDKYTRSLINECGIWAYKPDKAIDSKSDLFLYANFQTDKEWSINFSISVGGQAGLHGAPLGLGVNVGNVDLWGFDWNLNKGEFGFYNIEDNNARGSRGVSSGLVTIGGQSYMGGDYIDKKSMTTNFCGAGFGKSAGQWNISVGFAVIFGIQINVNSKIKN